MPSLFTQIIRGEIPCHKILEDERYIAILEKNPLTEGHTVVFPKVEVDHFFELDDETLSGLILFSKKISRALKKAVPCEKIAVLVYGLKVRHAHMHLVPVHGVAGEMNLSNQKNIEDSELAKTAEKIRACL
jgi:histidine triad (HIT) family protein